MSESESNVEENIIKKWCFENKVEYSEEAAQKFRESLEFACLVINYHAKKLGETLVTAFRLQEFCETLTEYLERKRGQK